MSSWENELARELKSRENPQLIGACIGTVISPLPNLKISILNGAVILNKEQLYITSGLKEKLFKAEMRGAKSGDITIRKIVYSANTETLDEDSFPSSRVKVIETAEPEQLHEITNLDLFDKDTIKIKLWFELKKGDEVLILPTVSEQQFFVIDKIEKVGG